MFYNPPTIQVFDKTANYIFNEGDHGNVLTFTANNDITCTLPNGLHIGFTVTVIQKGLGKISFSTPNDSKINGGNLSSKTKGAWSWAKIVCISDTDYTVEFGSASDGSGPGYYGDTDTRLTNPHITDGILYFDLLNVANGAVIANYESVPLPGAHSGEIKILTASYTLLPADDRKVLIFIPDEKTNVQTLTLYVPEALPANFACTIIPKSFLQSDTLSFEPAPGANVFLQNINGAFNANIRCQQILLQQLPPVGATQQYLLSFIEQTQQNSTSSPVLLSQFGTSFSMAVEEEADDNGVALGTGSITITKI